MAMTLAESMASADWATGVYRELLDKPGDTALMLILADALTDAGYGDLSIGYRWAASLGKWPFVRFDWRLQRHVWDWEADHRDLRIVKAVPDHAKLPREIYWQIKHIKNREYGTVDQAFVLLATVISGSKKPVRGLSITEDEAEPVYMI